MSFGMYRRHKFRTEFMPSSTKRKREASMTKIKLGDHVSIEYTGTLSDGQVFDSSVGKDPIEFNVGEGQVIPGFEQAVVGMEQGQEKTFTIEADQAYGPVRQEMILLVPREKMPPSPEPTVGMQMGLRTQEGNTLPARITKVENGIVTIDVNHPLAGQDLTFKIKVVKVAA